MNKPESTDLNCNDDLIVARATAPGAAALAIVRVDGSGSGIRALLETMFRPSGAQSPAAVPRLMIHGRWFDPASGETLDEGLAVYFAAPHSFTGNDLAEFYLHGGSVPVRCVIEAALALGARNAEPGEFTRRAFLNGKLDLTQAEAVADLINAQTAAAARLAQRQLGGALGTRLAALRERLLTLAAEIEARIDFPDEEIEPADRTRLAAHFDFAQHELATLLETRRRGRLLREGARIALVGRPNAGKSSLLNALARADRAIVTPHPGTTRDTIECTIDLAGMPVTLIDTAGLRESDDPTADPIELLGIQRTRQEIERADLIVLVLDATDGDWADASTDPSTADRAAREQATNELGRAPDLIVLNKIDLQLDPPRNAAASEGANGEINPLPNKMLFENPEPCGTAALGCAVNPKSPLETPPANSEVALAASNPILISALRGDGLADLEQALARQLTGDADASGARSDGDLGLAVNLRQGELLARAAESLVLARRAFDDGVSGELTMVDLRESLDALSEVTGLTSAGAAATTSNSEAILDRVFSQFCIGK